MILRHRRPFIVIALVLAFLTAIPHSLACGPFSLDAIFVHTVHPDYPLSDFARGKIGVVQPSYARSYLYVAYRYLSESTFTAAEQQELTSLWKDRIDFHWDMGETEWIKQWNATRAKVLGAGAAPEIDVYRHREKPNEYETYLNCQEDAFVTATATLEARIKSFGADSSRVRDWLTAQDQVFANCSEGQHIPEPLSTEPEPQARAERNYQIAAANFYAANFDEAAKQFTALESDSASPWRESGAYLAVRALVRKASLGAPENTQATLTEAEKRLTAILADTKRANSHRAAQRLMRIVRLRLYPEKRVHELAHSLLQTNQAEILKQDLWDYTVLLDQFLEGVDKSDVSKLTIDDDLTDWIVTFEQRTPASLEHALERWQTTRSKPWLIAALSKIPAKHDSAEALMAQATKISPESPAYVSAVFHLVRIDIQAGRFDEARRRLDQTLAQHRAEQTASSTNQLLGLRMQLAVNLREFLTYAQRVPAAFSWNDDGREVPADLKEQEDSTRSLQGQPLFDIDAAQILNRGLPLVMLRQAAESKALNTNLRRDVTQVAWLRAVLLGDYQTADRLVTGLKALVPQSSPLLEDFLSTSEADAKRFAAVYAWLKLPGLEPIVDAGTGRLTNLGEQDAYRDNWWCSSAFPPGSTPDVPQDKEKQPTLFDANPRTFPIFLSDADRAAAAKEYAALLALGAAPNYLCRQVIQWANKNPEDPRVPEALHLAVKTTRYGCTNKETGRWSKAAYDLLHKRYPNSTWAKRTPYWFKD